MTQEVANRERKVRDLRSQVAELSSNLEGEVVFQHIRTRRNPVTIYAMLDGEPIEIPEYMVGAALSKVLPDGRYMFTDNAAEVPEYKRGTVKCFLHAESAERATGILDEIGLAGKVCPAGGLASAHAKRMHGQHRHHQEWEAYTEYLSEQKDAEQREQQRKQLDATLALARGASESHGSEWLDAVADGSGDEFVKAAVAVATDSCDVCGKAGLKNVGAHKRGAHK